MLAITIARADQVRRSGRRDAICATFLAAWLGLATALSPQVRASLGVFPVGVIRASSQARHLSVRPPQSPPIAATLSVAVVTALSGSVGAELQLASGSPGCSASRPIICRSTRAHRTRFAGPAAGRMAD